MNKMLAILHLEHFPAIQHHRNCVNTTYPALQIPAGSSSETEEELPPKRSQKKRDGKKEQSSAAKELARPPANEWHNNLVPLNKLASMSALQPRNLDDVNEVDNQIRDLTPEIDDINNPFQGERLAKKVPPRVNFVNWVISRKVAWPGFSNSSSNSNFQTQTQTFKLLGFKLKFKPNFIILSNSNPNQAHEKKFKQFELFDYFLI